MSDNIVVYTAIFDGYDPVRDPIVVDKDVRYVLFTDDLDTVPSASIWEPRLLERDDLSPRKMSRYAKTHPHILFPNVDVTVWHGGNIQMNILPKDAVRKWLGRDYIAAFKHPHRTCAYDEIDACLTLDKGNKGVMRRQLDRYKMTGFPRNYGLTACWFLIRKNNSNMTHFNSRWWSEIEHGSGRDQLSFDFCRWQTHMDVDWIPGDLLTSPFFKRSEHGR